MERGTETVNSIFLLLLRRRRIFFARPAQNELFTPTGPGKGREGKEEANWITPSCEEGMRQAGRSTFTAKAKYRTYTAAMHYHGSGNSII